MKIRTTTIMMTAALGILALGAASVVQAATINFTGASWIDATDWHQEDNWDLGRVPTSGDTVNIFDPYALPVTLSGGGSHTEYQIERIVVRNPGASLTIENNAHLTLTLAAGTWPTETPRLSGVYNINEGSTLRAGKLRARHDVIININGGQHIVSQQYQGMDGTVINVTNGGLAKGGTLDLRSINVVDYGPSALNIDGGTAVFTNFDGSMDKSGVTTINFVRDDPVGKLIFTTDITNTVQSYIDAGWITNAQVAFGAYSYDQMGTDGSLATFSGNGTIITAIPEPGTIALMGLAGLVMLIRRRRSVK